MGYREGWWIWERIVGKKCTNLEGIHDVVMNYMNTTTLYDNSNGVDTTPLIYDTDIANLQVEIILSNL